MSGHKSMIQNIARRLKGLREAAGLSVEDLAERTGTAVPAVNDFEAGNCDIPVGFLAKAAQVCGGDLTALLTGADAHLHAYSLVRDGEGLAASRRRAYKYQSLAWRFARPRMEPFLITVPAMDAPPTEFSQHAGQEFIYLLRGRLEVRLGADTVVLNERDSLYFDSGTAHAMRGLDGREAVFLDVIS